MNAAQIQNKTYKGGAEYHKAMHEASNARLRHNDALPVQSWVLIILTVLFLAIVSWEIAYDFTLGRYVIIAYLHQLLD